jgi:hypothetical protein
MNIIPERTPAGTGEWSPGGLEELAGLIGVRIGAWNHFGYPAPLDCQAAIPPLGERSAEAVKYGRGAVEAIDELIRDLQVLRGHLVTEMRTDSDERAKRVDQLLTDCRARREAEQ